MTAAAIITLRETLEASLVVGIVLGACNLLNTDYKKWAWGGVGIGVLASMVVALLFTLFFGGLHGVVEEIFEGVIMLSAAAMITWMIFWIISARKSMKSNIVQKVNLHIRNEHPLGILMLVLLAVVREGVETVLFLKAAMLHTNGIGLHLFGAGTGIVVAIIAGVLFFKGLSRLPVKLFLSISGVMLLLFAAGLLAHGIHELQEAGIIPVIIEHVWDTNGILHEDGILGTMLKTLLGYNGNPSLIEVSAYILYLVGISTWWNASSRTQS